MFRGLCGHDFRFAGLKLLVLVRIVYGVEVSV